MAEAMVRGIIEKGVSDPHDIVLGEPLPERRRFLAKEYDIQVAADNLHVLDDASLIVLAIKPQIMDVVLPKLRNHLTESQTILSIAAGVGIERIRTAVEHDLLIRAMPNTPAQIGMGVTMWTSTEEVSEETNGFAASVLRALGQEIFVNDEKYLDMATAISGGGPAYVFMIIESLIDAGVHMGLARDVSQELVVDTLLGSAFLYRKSGKHPAELKNMVTSPGGTTAEALLMLEKAGLRGILIGAVLEAYKKAQDLGK